MEGGKEYSDLDELIVNHVQAIARRVEELMAYEKFKAGPEDELRESRFVSQMECGVSKLFLRPVPKELREGEPIQERLRIHSQSSKTGPLQSLLLGEQKFCSANLGMFRSIGVFQGTLNIPFITTARPCCP